jgi:hypothetical protein
MATDIVAKIDGIKGASTDVKQGRDTTASNRTVDTAMTAAVRSACS